MCLYLNRIAGGPPCLCLLGESCNDDVTFQGCVHSPPCVPLFFRGLLISGSAAIVDGRPQVVRGGYCRWKLFYTGEGRAVCVLRRFSLRVRVPIVDHRPSFLQALSCCQALSCVLQSLRGA